MYLQHALTTYRILPQSVTLLASDYWEQLGPAPLIGDGHPQTGRIDTIAVHPTNPNIIYIGAAEGGVWRTTNGGASWTPLTDDQPSLAMGSIAIAPSNPNIVYAGTGDMVGFYGAGLLRSANGGDSWTHIPGPFDTATEGAIINKVVVASNNPNHIVIASSIGVFRSTSGGLDLTATSTPALAGNATDLVIHPTNPNIVYAALFNEGTQCGGQACGGGLFRSANGGQTWPTRIGAGTVSCALPLTTACQTRRTHLAIALTNPNIVYALVYTPPDGGGMAVFRYNDQTQTSTKMADSPANYSGFCRGQCWYNLTFAVQPVDPDGAGPLVAENILYAGGTWDLRRSTDGGNSWPVSIRDGTSGRFHVDIHAFAFDSNGALYVGSDGGIVRHANPATAVSNDQNWTNINGNLAITQFYPGISVHPTDPYFAIGGTQDNGVLKYTGILTWDQLTSGSGGDGGMTGIAESDPKVMWYAVGLPSELMMTSNEGSNWTDVKGDLDDDGDGKSEFGVFGGFKVTPYVIHPGNPKLVILGLNSRVWRTTTGAQSNDPSCGKRWCKNSLLLTGGVTALAFAPSNSQVYYAGGGGAVHRTIGGGGTCATCWQDLSAGFPNRFVTDLAVHPTQPTIVYATASGFCGTNPCPAGQGHVFVNINAAAWADISNNLPDVPVNAIALDPANPNTIYVGTDLGIFRSVVAFPGQMPTWEAINDGLPNSAVFDLAFNDRYRTLTAATFGRGMFRLQLCPQRRLTGQGGC